MHMGKCADKENTIATSLNISAKIKNSETTLVSNQAILIVDDESSLLDLAHEQIESLGYKVYSASSGEQALQLLAEYNDIGLLFSDVIMPGGLTGYELAIKAMALRPNLKLLLASGFTIDAMKQKGLVLLDAKILNKPYRLEELAAKLDEVLTL